MNGRRKYSEETKEKLLEATNKLKDGFEPLKRKAYAKYLEHSRNRLGRAMEHRGDLADCIEGVLKTLEILEANKMVLPPDAMKRVKRELTIAHTQLAERTEKIGKKIAASKFLQGE